MKAISRREFLRDGALGAAGLALASSLTGCEGMGRKPEGALRFVHVTDTHMDLSKPKTVARLERFVAQVNRRYPDLDFVLFGGDNFNNNVPGNRDALVFQKIASRLSCPWYAVRGNKESTPKPAGDPLGQEAFARMFFSSDLEVKGRDWKLEKGGFTILGLDSTIEQHGNGIYTAETLDFAEKELKARPGRDFVLLNHHPYTNFWGGTEEADLHKYVLNNAEEVRRRLFGYPNLKLTLSGHKHLDAVNKVGGVTVIATLGFVVPQKTLEDHRYRLVEMGKGGIRQEVVSIL